MTRLGPAQSLALRSLGRAPGGLTVTDLAPALAHVASTGVVYGVLAGLADKGLARVSGTVPNADPLGKGARRKVWTVTRKGRQMLAEVTR